MWKNLYAFNSTDSVELLYYDQELLLEAQKKGSVESTGVHRYRGKDEPPGQGGGYRPRDDGEQA